MRDEIFELKLIGDTVMTENVITYDRAEGILTAIHGPEALPILKAQYAMSLDHIARLDKPTVTLGRDV